MPPRRYRSVRPVGGATSPTADSGSTGGRSVRARLGSATAKITGQPGAPRLTWAEVAGAAIVMGAAVASVTGGFLFGLGPGTALNALSATLGASAIFWAATTGLGQTLSRKLDASEGRVGALNAALRENEVSVLLLLRLVPAVPFFVANLLPALVGVKFRTYFWTTALGILPGALVFTSIGVGVGEVFDRGETPDLSLLRAPAVLWPLLGLCALALLPILVRSARGRREF